VEYLETASAGPCFFLRLWPLHCWVKFAVYSLQLDCKHCQHKRHFCFCMRFPGKPWNKARWALVRGGHHLAFPMGTITSFHFIRELLNWMLSSAQDNVKITTSVETQFWK
jgi:hypothetical protein